MGKHFTLWTKYNQIPPMGENDGAVTEEGMSLHSAGALCMEHFTPDPKLTFLVLLCMPSWLQALFVGVLAYNTLGCSQIKRVEGPMERYDAAEV